MNNFFIKEFQKFKTSISGLLSPSIDVNIPDTKIEKTKTLLKALKDYYENIKDNEQFSVEEKKYIEQQITSYEKELEELQHKQKNKISLFDSHGKTSKPSNQNTPLVANEKITNKNSAKKSSSDLPVVLLDNLNEKVIITETTKNSFDDLNIIYDYLQIFNNFESNHTYKIDRYERKNNLVFNYTNYVSGIIDMNKLKPKSFPKTKTGAKNMQDAYEYRRTLQDILSLNKIKSTILNNYGNIGILKKNEYGAYIQKTTLNASNNKLYKDFGKRINLKRTDGTELLIVKVGTLKVSKDKQLFDELDQYAIFTHNNYESVQEHLVYGKIDFDELLESETYKHTVCNTLLSENNLSNIYVGSITTYKGAYYINRKSSIEQELMPYYYKNNNMQSIDIPL